MVYSFLPMANFAEIDAVQLLKVFNECHIFYEQLVHQFCLDFFLFLFESCYISYYALIKTDKISTK